MWCQERQDGPEVPNYTRSRFFGLADKPMTSQGMGTGHPDGKLRALEDLRVQNNTNEVTMLTAQRSEGLGPHFPGLRGR
jgi:hypothetical protein